MNKVFLRLALWPSGIWKSMGADTDQLRAILEVKLKLDDRKPVSFGKQAKQKKNRRFSSGLAMFISFFTGLIYIFPLAFIPDRVLSLSVFFTMFLFLLTFTLITDFSNVLIDTRDKYIVLLRPVNDQTLFLSRMLHIFIYLFRIVLPMSLPAWITLGIIDGWRAAVWFPFPLLLLVFTTLFLVMGVYLLMLRLASAERFKDILGYFQLKDFLWTRYFPSYWLASTWSWIHPHSVPPGSLYFSVLAVLLPVICLWVTVRWLAPQFAARLGGLDASEGNEHSAKASQQQVKGSNWMLRLATGLNHRPEAQAGFMMAWLQTARSRAFKMKIYPMFAYVPIYFVYLMTMDKLPLKEVYAGLRDTSKHLVLLYMSCVVVASALSLVNISEQYKAAWIYYAVPLSTPGAIMAGAFKAMWVKYFLPFFAVISVFVLVIWGLPAIVDILLALTNVTLFAIFIARISGRKLPFSQIDQMNSGGSRFLRGLVMLAIPGTLGVGHYLALHMVWLKLLYLVLSAIMVWLVWDSYANTKWADMKKEELA